MKKNSVNEIENISSLIDLANEKYINLLKKE